MLKLVSHETKLDFDDVLIVPQRTVTASRKAVDTKREFMFYHSPRKWKGLPIMVANMGCTGTFMMGFTSHTYKAITCISKHETWLKEQMILSQDSYWYSIGMSDDDLDRIRWFPVNFTPNICIDVANGYSSTFVDYCAQVREILPDCIIMAGNVCTPEQVQELIISGGVDIVKIGIGPGSACTTRIQTGVGYPQLSAIAECAACAHGLKSGERRMGLVCADGGCKTAGDVCKAFCAGADFVMSGGMFAGTDECNGEWEYHDMYEYVHDKKASEAIGTTIDGTLVRQGGKKFLKFYGMSSFHAQEKHNGGRKDYRGSEGRVVRVPYKGSAHAVFQEIEAGIRSCASYIGATCIKDMNKCAKFVRVAHGNTHNRVFEN